MVANTRAVELYRVSSRSGTVNCANLRARPAIIAITTRPHHPPAGCHSATNPFRYAFSPPPSRLPAPIQELSSVNTSTVHGSFRPATRKSLRLRTDNVLAIVTPHSVAITTHKTTM